jgi:hypothetical protein
MNCVGPLWTKHAADVVVGELLMYDITLITQIIMTAVCCMFGECCDLLTLQHQ